MLAIAYVILPVTDIAPADAIRASLSGFQKPNNGDLSDELRALEDRMEALRSLHQAPLSFTDGDDGLRIEGGGGMEHHLDEARIRGEMRRRGSRTWQVRFVDTMDLDTFLASFCLNMQRHPVTGEYHYWDTSRGRWNWWDLGGRFDGCIIGEPHSDAGRLVAPVSSGEHMGRMALAAIEEGTRTDRSREHEPTVEIREDRNIAPAAALLAAARAGQWHAYPMTLVLPPGSVEEHLRWLDAWPLGPVEAFARLGLTAEATWKEVAEAAYARFQDHWVACVSYWG